MRKTEIACYTLAVLFFLLGASMRFVFTAVRFTGFLLWCGAAALVLFALLDRWGQRRAWARGCKRLLLVLMVILGAGVNGTQPSLSLESRLEAALYYIGQDPGQFPIVVTGSQGPGEEISEARCMAQWLVEHQVDPDRILLEEQAGTTEENVAYSKVLLAAYGVEEGAAVAVVTSDYHLCRAKWLWGGGMHPVAAYMPGQFWPLTVNYYVREAFALAAAIVF